MGKREWSAWRAAYEAQGQGRYGTALAATEETLAGPPEVAAAARATRGSVLRQVRLHARAEAEDHAGLDLAPGDPALLIGLVADAVGQGTPTDARLAAAWASQPADWRQQVRLAWVTGEVALTHDDRETGAGAFGQALDLARTHDATRHEAKSLLFLGVATDDPVLLRTALDLATDGGYDPIRWPALLMLGEHEEAERIRLALVDSLPEPLRSEAR
jgi:hypothetical protein